MLTRRPTRTAPALDGCNVDLSIAHTPRTTHHQDTTLHTNTALHKKIMDVRRIALYRALADTWLHQSSLPKGQDLTGY